MNSKEEKKSKAKKIINIAVYLFAIIGLIFVVLVLFELAKGENDEEKIIDNNDDISSKEIYDGVIYDEDSFLDRGRYSYYNEKIDFDILKTLLNEEKNIVYSPLSIKESLLVLSRLAGNNTHDQIFNLYPVEVFPLAMESDDIKMSETGIFLKNDGNDDLCEKVDDTLQYSNISYTASVADNLTPELINDWVKRVTLDRIEKIYDESADLSENTAIISSITAIDMQWKNKIAGGMYLNPAHEKFSCETYSFDGVGYEHLLFNNMTDSSGLEFAVAANKYDIINDLGYDNIKNTVYEAYTDWYNEENSDYYDTPDEYIEQYMKEISQNYGEYDTSTDFKYSVDDDIKVFYKTLKQYDNIELEYIGIMPKKQKLNNFVNKVDGKYLDHILSNLKEIDYFDLEEGYCTKIHGIIPVFEYNNSILLKDQLKSFGIEDVFDINKSDFSPITDNTVFLNNFRNDTEISFSNEGIKAISYTVCDGLGQGMPDFDYLFDVPIIDIDLTFDKPFIYFIREKGTNQIFFSGAVYEPLEYVQSGE